ncbi:MAG: glycosyltransferase family 2 protein [Hyphomicrobiales bacterium]|nr:glycosyltransferase family 2 protein [Hyphomicrobiales bacterium]
MRVLVSAPYPNPGGFPSLPKASLYRPLARSFRDLVPGMSSKDVWLHSFDPRKVEPLSHDDLPLIVITHNDIKLIRSFIAHYRHLGVTRFLCVDDVSDDGTREFLSGQADVDLYTSNVRYKTAWRGRLWRQMLVARYGGNRWYMFVDPDEFLVYSGYETVALPSLIEALAQRGVLHFPAPMLDMYPPGRVGEADYDGGGDEPPWTVADLFDATGYTLRGDERSWKIEGGVRHRVFGSRVQLIKYPLVYWGAMTNLNKNVHTPAPYWRNYAPLLGTLLHFKFFGDYWTQFKSTVANGQHFLNGAFYGDILQQIDDPDRLVLESDVSAPFIGADDLIQRGFFSNWS